DRAGRGHGSEAALWVSAVLAQVLIHQGFQRGPLVLGQGALVLEDRAQGPGLIEHPGVHGGDEGVAAEEVQLQGQDAEEKVAVGRGAAGGGLGHGLVLVSGRSGATARWFQGKSEARRLLYLEWRRWARKNELSAARCSTTAPRSRFPG